MAHLRRIRTITDPVSGRRYPIPAGGADDDSPDPLDAFARVEGGDEVAEVVSRIGTDDPPSDDELADLYRVTEDRQALGVLVEAAQAQADADDPDVEVVEAIRHAVTAIRGEQTARAEQAAETRRRTDEALADIYEVPEPVVDEPEAVEEPADEPVEDEPEAADESADEDADEPQPVAADGRRQKPKPKPRRRPSLSDVSRRRPAEHAPQPQGNPALTVVAAGDVPGVSAGTRFHTLRDIGEAFNDLVHNWVRSDRRAASGTGRRPVARFNLDYPDNRTLTADGGVENDRAVQKIVDGLTWDALVASGGRCAPLDVSYSMENVSSDDRPVRDALVRFGADRGGVTAIDPPTIDQLAGAVDIHTETEDTEGATKPCLTVTCGNQTSVDVHAVTKCIEIGNWNRRFFPEQFNTFWALAGSQHAREAEDQLWNDMVTASIAVVAGDDGTGLGAARQYFAILDRAQAGMRSRHRILRSQPLQVFVPEWVQDLLRADLSRQLPGDGSDHFAVADQMIRDWHTRRQIQPVFSPDGGGQVFSSQGVGGAPLNQWPDTAEVILTHPGAFVFLDGGTLDFGMEIRDSVLNSTNDSQAFLETFEGVWFRGVESLSITMDLCPNGAAAATVDTTGLCTTGS